MRKELSEWLSKIVRQRRTKRRLRKTRETIEEVNHRLQIREWDDNLYIALDNQPLLAYEDISANTSISGVTICDMLSAARNNMANYLLEKR